MTDGYSRPAGDPDLLGGETIPPTPPAPSIPSSGSTYSSSGGTKDTAKQEAAGVAQGAGESAKQVAGTAKEEAKRTAAEAQRQAKDLLKQGQSQLREQTSAQQSRLAGGLRSISGELDQMAEGSSEPGIATNLARQASQYADQASTWLEQREPSDLLQDVQRFARRRPGAFLAIAAGLGVLAGRLTRGLKDVASDDDDDYAGTSSYGSAGAPAYGTTGTSTGYGTTGTYSGYGDTAGGGYTTAPTGYGTASGTGTTSTATGYTTVPADDTALDDAPAEYGPGAPGAPFDEPYTSGGAR